MQICLRRIEKRFEKQPELKEAYTSFMSEYEEMHHMQVVPPDQVNFEPSSFFRHHPVIKKDGSNKVRVVFNASQKTLEGFSLNSFLPVSPKLQEDVVALITR